MSHTLNSVAGEDDSEQSGKIWGKTFRESTLFVQKGTKTRKKMKYFNIAAVPQHYKFCFYKINW